VPCSFGGLYGILVLKTVSVQFKANSVSARDNNMMLFYTGFSICNLSSLLNSHFKTIFFLLCVVCHANCSFALFTFIWNYKTKRIYTNIADEYEWMNAPSYNIRIKVFSNNSNKSSSFFPPQTILELLWNFPQCFSNPPISTPSRKHLPRQSSI
jgi:hypothetical protein